MRTVKVGDTWRHVKRNSTYLIVCIDARMQINSRSIGDGAYILEKLEFVAYTSFDNQLYFRPKEEFLDGRFEWVGGLT